MGQGRGRNTGHYQRTRAAFRADCARQNRPCWLCLQPIDYAASSDLPGAFSLDHAVPLSLDPDRAEDPTNYRPAHRDCNLRRGNRAPQPPLGATSRRW